MKNNKLLISILSVFVLLFVSCKDSLIHDFNEQKETATLSFSVNGSSSRNILPDTSIDDFTNVVLTGTLNGAGAQIALGTWDSIEEMLEASLEVDVGSWNLNLSVKKRAVYFGASTTVTVTAGQNATASFVLNAVNTENGIANIKLRYPEEANIALVQWTFTPVNNNSALLGTSYSSGSITGMCCTNSTLNAGEAVQEIKDDFFTLETELPSGKYLLSCIFGSQYGEIQVTNQGIVGATPIGDYYNYIVIQPGLESKLDYTIDYFELLGITNAVSTAAGMELTIQVPKGVENIMVQRVTNFNEVMSNQTEENFAKNCVTFVKLLEAPTTSSTTMTLVDSYGYTANQELTYVVCYNYLSGSPMSAYYVKNFTTEYNGYEVPGFSTAPEFATESDQDGKTTKIRLVNEPVIDWKGHKIDSDYIIILSEYYEAAMYFEPDYVFTKTEKEDSVDPNHLHAGANALPGYRLCFENDGWYYNFGVDKTGLSRAQLPVLYGSPNAIPTSRGIRIEVYCEWSEGESERVKLLRSTDDPDGEYIIIKDYSEIRGQNFMYIDRKNLEKDVTYYYKLVGENGNNYVEPYFSATSSINFGIPLQIITNSKLEVSEDCIASFTPGNYQLDEHVGEYVINYKFRQADNDGLVLLVKKRYRKQEGEWVSYDLDADILQYDSNGSLMYYPNGIFEKVGLSNTSMSLFAEEFNDNEFTFERAYIECFDDGEDYKELFETIDFTPGAQECPSTIVIHTRRILLDQILNDEGITLLIENIPQEADSISVISTYEDYHEYELFKVENISSSSISLLDSYVSSGYEYRYTVQAYDGETLLDWASSWTEIVTATGGLGEPALTASISSDGISVSFDKVQSSQQIVCREEMYSVMEDVLITPVAGCNSFTDYYVDNGSTYLYSLSTKINYADNITYTLRRGISQITADAGCGSPRITTLPTYELTLDENNNKPYSVTFTGEPVLSTSEGMPDFSISSLNLHYKYDSINSFDITYTGSNTEILRPTVSGDFFLQAESYAVFSCSDYTYEGDVWITDTESGLWVFDLW